jgi:hypothetical protein
MLKEMMAQYTTKRLSIKDLVLDVIKSKPENMTGIAPAAEKEDVKDDISSSIS